MKKILVPVDFSNHSEYALKVAATLAKRHDAEIILLHMLGLSQAILTKNEGQEVAEAIYYMKLAKKRFGDIKSHAFLDEISVSEIVQNYKDFNEINEVANDQGVDIIIMGSHGSKGLSEVFVGSNTEKVVRTSDIPVLVIKKEITDFMLDRVVFACDFKTENVLAYRKAMRLFQLLGAAVDLVYVNLPGTAFKSSTQIDQRAEEFLTIADFDAPIRPDEVVYLNGYSIEQAIFDYAYKAGADALAIPTHGRRGLAHFFNGSIGEDIANHAELPVFTFKI
ncbi:universal stress protein UspA [Dokdonia pacifica]|uniref:Nucleotide-binding universal stress protein, UspA family n=1 Tax=Dokdonia pacifica TaxID=1627892 RepID=A0A239BHW7_9FLAO|nr:universal stress protein [Dokdonia pacifica]GGG29419.1 universal stress protein UspA [Dokdonia pacifica]SNS07279.1 Nucleotide-binding universal stress protein, UspA family [Dokdonia pacifica]